MFQNAQSLTFLFLLASSGALAGAQDLSSASPGKEAGRRAPRPARILLPRTPALPAFQPRIKQEPIYFTTMTHMEASFRDDRDRRQFQDHVRQLRFAMDLYEAYGAKMTVESERPFSRACLGWGLNMLQEVLERGHGVGTHCDVGFREELMPTPSFATLLQERKDLVDQLVGRENNRHFSGGGGRNDWALAGNMAGFEFIDGIVSMHYLSMPYANRPPEYTDEYILEEGGHHDSAPAALEDRLHLYGVADAQDFQADTRPVIVISNGELGALSKLAEARRGQPGEALDAKDVQALQEIIEEAEGLKQPGQIAKLCVYLPVSIFTRTNERTLRLFFRTLQSLHDAGRIRWATQGEVFDAYQATQDTISNTCDPSDRFVFTDLGRVVGATDLGLDPMAGVADPSPLLTADGRVRVYYLAGASLGIRSMISEDGISFSDEGQRVNVNALSFAKPIGPERVVRLSDGRVRMFVGTPAGFQSLISSDDGLTFSEEAGVRIALAETGMEKVTKLSPVEISGGSFRAYFSRAPQGGSFSPREVLSATSPDLFSFALEAGIRVGPGSADLTDSSREVCPLARGAGGVTLFYVRDDHLPQKTYSATSRDGLTFSEEHLLEGMADDSAGPALLLLPNGKILLYHDATTEAEGHHIRVGTLELAP
jgi:hypothetical protein